MFKKSFKGKIILSAVIVLVALVIVLTTFLSIRFTTFSGSLINEKLIANINSLKLYLDDSEAKDRKSVV